MFVCVCTILHIAYIYYFTQYFTLPLYVIYVLNKVHVIYIHVP